MWGDGSISDATVVPDSASGVFDVQASHAYVSTGQFQPSVSVIDSDGMARRKSSATWY